jgi:cytochrome b involved in lipid metabolism
MHPIKEYSIEEVSLHNSKESLWVIIDAHIFDLTKFKTHPGGWNILLKWAGKDATIPFDDARHVDGISRMDEFCIGKLDKQT